MTRRSGIFALTAALAIVLPFLAVLVASPTGALGTDTATVAVSGSPNPGTTGTITYDVTVTGDGVDGNPTGSVSVADGAGGTCSITDITMVTSCTISEDASGSPYAVTATYSGDATYAGATSPPISEIVNPATPTTPSITNLPTSGTFNGGFTAVLGGTDGDGTLSLLSNSPGVCTVGAGEVVSYVGVGTCSLTTQVSAGTNYIASAGTQTILINSATPTTPTITNLPTSGTFNGGFTAVLGGTDGDGTLSLLSNSPGVCTVGAGEVVSYVGVGTCSLTTQVSAGTNYIASAGTQTILIGQANPTTPTITNLPTNGTFGGNFVASVQTNGDGTTSVVSSSAGVCTVGTAQTVSYVGVGLCSLTAQVAVGTNYLPGSGPTQSFTIGRATATTPTITNIPSPANEFFGFTPILGTTGDGTATVTSSTPKVCSVGSNGLTVTFVGFGTCTLTPSVAQGANYFGATGSPQSFPVQEASHGYWLVGSDGGIFSFGTAAFHGSMGSTPLQRPVVAITPTLTGNGYWLVASDGGIFSFGDSTYYGSLPALGFHPAGSGLPQSLNAPIVGMVPSFTGHGYFMVASDGGVFAFGDAKFEGSCPGIGGCSGTAVAVMPDQSGKGYWLVTTTGAVYAFGDAAYYGAPTPSSVPVVDAVATRDGNGYWLLFANGVVDNFGDATNFGAPVGYVNGFNAATTIFPTADDQGYWVASARGDVFSYGDSPFLGSEAAAGLNGEIIGAFGF